MIGQLSIRRSCCRSRSRPLPDRRKDGPGIRRSRRRRCRRQASKSIDPLSPEPGFAGCKRRRQIGTRLGSIGLFALDVPLEADRFQSEPAATPTCRPRHLYRPSPLMTARLQRQDYCPFHRPASHLTSVPTTRTQQAHPASQRSLPDTRIAGRWVPRGKPRPSNDVASLPFHHARPYDGPGPTSRRSLSPDGCMLRQ